MPELAPSCPHCSAPLKKPPKRKAGCKSCGEDIYVRTTQEIFPSPYLTEEQAKAADWLRRVGDQGLTIATYREKEKELQRRAGDAEPLEVIRAMLVHLIERGENRGAFWQMARFKADMGEDTRDAQRDAFRQDARFYTEAHAKGVTIIANTCCEACFPLHETEYAVEELVRDPKLPPDGCTRDLCSCRYDPQFDYMAAYREQFPAPKKTPVRKPAASGCLVLLVAASTIAVAATALLV